jgi:hypothetical protein
LIPLDDAMASESPLSQQTLEADFLCARRVDLSSVAALAFCEVKQENAMYYGV